MQRIRTASLPGVELVVCNLECASRWQFTHLADQFREVRVDTITARPRHDCAACAMCGKTLARPTNGSCIRHGDDCPTVDVFASDYCRQVVRRVGRETGAQLTDAGWEYLLAYAEEYGNDVPRIVAALVRVESDWNRPIAAA
ncbi:hypothetical protein [Blastococcus mobilis]|uniref:Uncharacterized protein n=1 Tax=Blastococcus mobilis TaxID=1938746 RepID=A0A238VXF9_9ACTN|nr:hypothetical protein [Blastococcus mobilis]SNR38824.1 hypothetical protein SAMN06272737_105126 [Blastococcus mobilis]